jgi:hypothetical protein
MGVVWSEPHSPMQEQHSADARNRDEPAPRGREPVAPSRIPHTATRTHLNGFALLATSIRLHSSNWTVEPNNVETIRQQWKINE